MGKGWFVTDGRAGDRTLAQQLVGLDKINVQGATVLDVGCAEGLISIEMAKRGAAGPGTTRRGKAGLGKARHSEASRVLARTGKVRHGMARQGKEQRLFMFQEIMMKTYGIMIITSLVALLSRIQIFIPRQKTKNF